MGKFFFLLLAILIPFKSFAGEIKTPESAQFYKNKIYVSNIGNLPPNKKDGDGFIAVLNSKGKFKKILTKGLNAPKGITFVKDKLYVTDIDTVVVIDINSGKIIKKIPIEGARFLNDITANREALFVSDTQINTIFKIPLSTLKPEIFVKSYKLKGPNGLAFNQNGELICVSWNSGDILKVSKEKIEKIGHIKGNLDGLVIEENGNLIVSDFKNGKIYEIRNGKTKLLIENLITPADIGYNKGKLAIPEFFANKIIIKKVN
ncbi:hypothetical protein [Desulfurobacterium atlanticum]|uniref:Sugar lactone lactonase YvrE n=1 Tax=Desulfurobacterium atlanticum TaxID=240169 RepID=A0A238YWW7_9BACT|nr:hypothetical protein [Desulfurobacterium atlanticum]SNR75231.1 hypothetical protein SAMN06265340_10546 [Desulfurobacterium atlanticum]